MILALIVSGTLGYFFLKHYEQAVLDFEQAIMHVISNTVIHDRHGQPFRTLRGVESRLLVSRNAINRNLQISIIAAEDARFFQHRGIDIVRMFGAFWVNLRSGNYRQGASTITQQLVKLTLLTPERTLSRKFKEIFIALSLEMKLSKTAILEHYLNKIYLGHGNYGVEQAAQAYFHKHASELRLSESAFIAAIIKKPEHYLRLPKINLENKSYFPQSVLVAALTRQRIILKQLYEFQWIKKAAYQQALNETIHVHLPKPSSETGAYFVQHVVNLLKTQPEFQNKVQRIYGGGYHVYTTIDPELQRLGESSILALSPKTDPEQVALVSLEPHTGYVRTLIGGKDFAQSQFNRATQAKRQPGSAFKAFLFATALEQGYTPNTVFVDQEPYYEWVNEDGTSDFYAPKNYDGLYGVERTQTNVHGEKYYADQMTMGKAFEKSINTIAVQIMNEIGVATVRETVKTLGIPVSEEVGLCLALGCAETRLLDLVSAYSPFVNQGKRFPPVFITRITDSTGKILYQYQPKDRTPIFTEWTMFQMRNMLQGVIERGTGRQAKFKTDHLLGGKTGTNSEYRDAWFVGFSPELVTGVWMGHDDNTPMKRETGGRTPAKIWKKFMEPALSKIPARILPPDPEHKIFPTCTVSGELATRNSPDVAFYAYPPENPKIRPCTVHPGLPYEVIKEEGVQY